MATTKTTSTTNGVTTVSKTTTPDPKKGAGWIANTDKKTKKKTPWIKPPKPATGDFAWDDNKGWVSSAAQSAAWGIPLAIIEGDTELKKLFNDAWAAQKAGTEWTQEYFTVLLQATSWYKTRSEAQRDYYTLSNDPAQAAEFARQIKESEATIADIAGLSGVSLAGQELTDLAKAYLQNGYNDSELRNFISTYVSYSGLTEEEKVGSLFGSAGDAEDQIREWAKKNNVTLSNDWVLEQAKGIVANNFDVNKSKDYITNLARQQYSGYADKLDASTSVEDLAAGYRQLVASEFDDSFENITIKNQYVDAAMRKFDANGQPASNETVKKDLRMTNEWADVKKNADQIMGVGRSILTRMGF